MLEGFIFRNIHANSNKRECYSYHVCFLHREQIAILIPPVLERIQIAFVCILPQKHQQSSQRDYGFFSFS